VNACDLSRPFAEALLRAGHCAEQLPEVRAAFQRGDLSLEKVRLISTVATPDDQAEWVAQALRTTPPQLARQIREARTAGTTEPERERLQRSLRYLHTWNDEVGMLRISGALPREDGCVVKAALDQYRNAIAERDRGNVLDLDPAEDVDGARDADALVALCIAASGGSGEGRPPVPVQMVVHVDLDVLTGENPAGRGHLEEGPVLSLELLETLGCDASVKAIVERDGVEVGATRDRRIVPAGVRRKVQSRDRICRFPGCAKPAIATHAHHLWHWRDGGPSREWNVLSLCTFHHPSLHRGEYQIVRTEAGDLTFKTRDGQLIGTATGGWWKRPLSSSASPAIRTEH
ncbi:MAG: DUF222 domain-containing protein, partial [Candidatus Dormibacteria bacterium]